MGGATAGPAVWSFAGISVVVQPIDKFFFSRLLSMAPVFLSLVGNGQRGIC